MEVRSRSNNAVTSDPLDFFAYLKGQNEKLYGRVIDFIIFEEVEAECYRLQKLHQMEIWDQNTKRDLDLLWWTYCLLRP